MQMPGQHPDRDACIHRWMPASRGRCLRVQSNSSSAYRHVNTATGGCPMWGPAES